MICVGLVTLVENASILTFQWCIHEKYANLAKTHDAHKVTILSLSSMHGNDIYVTTNWLLSHRRPLSAFRQRFRQPSKELMVEALTRSWTSPAVSWKQALRFRCHFDLIKHTFPERVTARWNHTWSWSDFSFLTFDVGPITDAGWKIEGREFARPTNHPWSRRGLIFAYWHVGYLYPSSNILICSHGVA